MDTVSVGIVLSIATLIVVGTASVAAIVQLRHLRANNQLSALLEIMNQWNLPPVQAALAELHAIPTKLADPEYVAALKAPGTIDRANHPELLALDLWEQISTFAKHGLVDESILHDILQSQVASAWKAAEPAIALMRERRGDAVYENFEYLAVRGKLWLQKHPHGSYPARVPRMREL